MLRFSRTRARKSIRLLLPLSCFLDKLARPRQSMTPYSTLALDHLRRNDTQPV